MRIGLVNIYSFRPHVEHLYYLSVLLESAGHDTFFLTCDSSVDNCYARMLKGTSRLSECTKCIVGGIRSYPTGPVTSISKSVDHHLSEETLDNLALSSSCTLTRIEKDTDWYNRDVVQVRSSLHRPIAQVYDSAIKWIESNHLDAVICFNGRMDLTRAVTHACVRMGIPYVTHERTWFGHGIQLIPNGDCLSLAPINALSKEFRDSPLTEEQARHAAKLVADRFLRKNSLEWRVYNEDPTVSKWPLRSSGARVLILPSSKNEFAAHRDWQTGWTDNTRALDDFLEAFSVNANQVVLRCHPNWAEKIGNISGHRSMEVYKNWANDRGIHLIASEDKESTYDLIQQSDIVVLNGGSSAVEAGVCGKQIICLGPAIYSEAGFARMFFDRDSLYLPAAREPLPPRDVMRRTLRFLYLSDRRYPQYVDFVRALQTIKYRYYEGADPERLVQIIKSGRIEADDNTVALGSDAEDKVIAILENRDWRTLSEHVAPEQNRERLEIARRSALKWVDTVRARFALGDR